MNGDGARRAAGAGVALGVSLGERHEVSREFVGCGFRGSAGREAREHEEVMAPLAAIGRERGVVLERSPDVGRGREDVFKIRGHHADDGDERAIESELAAEDGGIGGEAAFPEPVADDRDGGRVLDVVGRREITAQRGRNAERTEVIGSDALPFESFRFAGADDRGLPGLGDGSEFDGARMAGCEAKECAVGGIFGRAVIARFPDHGDAIGVGIWKRLEEDRIHGAKDRGGGSDADGESRDRDDGESGMTKELASTITEIGEEIFDGIFPGAGADLILDCGGAAGFEECGAAGGFGGRGRWRCARRWRGRCSRGDRRRVRHLTALRRMRTRRPRVTGAIGSCLFRPPP